jgi:hypothetical protein
MKPINITLSCDIALAGQTSVHSGVKSFVHSALTHALGSPKRAVHSLLLEQASRGSVFTTTLQLQAASRLAPKASSPEARLAAARSVWLNV